MNSHINHIKSFRLRLAQPKTELHTELSISMNFVKNFCLRHTINLNTDIKHDTAFVYNVTRRCLEQLHQHTCLLYNVQRSLVSHIKLARVHVHTARSAHISSILSAT